MVFQIFRNVKLYFWANVEETHPLIREVFAPLAQYGKYFEIKKFDAAAEFKKLASHYETREQGIADLNLGDGFWWSETLGSSVYRSTRRTWPDMTRLRFGSERTAELINIYQSQTITASKSDLMRAVLLYNYGGAWMDSDVVLVQDLTPLLEEDWAVLMYANFVNPAAKLSSVASCSRLVEL